MTVDEETRLAGVIAARVYYCSGWERDAIKRAALCGLRNSEDRSHEYKGKEQAAYRAGRQARAEAIAKETTRATRLNATG